MTEKTARKYRRLGKLPSQCRVVHDWKTREDVFAEDWPWAEELLKDHPGLDVKDRVNPATRIGFKNQPL